MTFSLFGNKKPLDPKPRWETYDVHGPEFIGGPDGNLQEDENAAFQQALSDWREIKNTREDRDNIYKQMAQKTGDTAQVYRSKAGTREAPPNMMTSLFPSKFGVASAAPVDILSPEIESVNDLYRKRQNMFRYS